MIIGSAKRAILNCCGNYFRLLDHISCIQFKKTNPSKKKGLGMSRVRGTMSDLVEVNLFSVSLSAISRSH